MRSSSSSDRTARRDRASRVARVNEVTPTKFLVSCFPFITGTGTREGGTNVRGIDHKHQTRRNVASRRWYGRHRHPHRWFSGLTDAAQGGHGAPHCNRLENRSSVPTAARRDGRSAVAHWTLYLLDCTR